MIDTQTQIERRRERAATDIARVVNRGGHIAFSTFDVTSTSDRTYRVQIRSLTELQNSCTCPDYLTNLVGTCKHIEGVLLNLKGALGEQWDRLAAQAPSVTQIYLHHAEEATIRVLPAAPVPREVQAVLDRYFDAGGVLPGPVLRTLPALLADVDALPGRARRHLLIADEVRAHLDRLQDLDAIRRQKEWFLEQVAQGTRSLSLLSTRLYPYQESGAMHLAFGARAMLAELPAAEVYRAPAMAAQRLKLAQVVLEGGFPEEVLRPLREALGWTLTSLVGLFRDYTPAADLPSPRLVNAELVEPGRMPADLAGQLSRVRELTAPPEEGEDAPPPSLEAAAGLIAGIQEAIDLGRQFAAQAAL